MHKYFSNTGIPVADRQTGTVAALTCSSSRWCECDADTMMKPHKLKDPMIKHDPIRMWKTVYLIQAK